MTTTGINFEDMDSIKVNNRGHRWIQTSISNTDKEFLEKVRKDWTDVSDDEIIKSKKIITELFGDNTDGIKGLPCKNFIYMFSDDNINHYFACTDENLKPLVIKCEGECDMYFSQSADFDLILMQRDDMY
tara:strand:+ start:6235 stop:6624 length:390 start_codon:yes stop_codon:yes gene_type:complete